uniref:Fibronectin type-III domain-containing protein n=1 Tax=Clastoptera arizonana TaxID=38151 RepID=A0A1B6DYW8_9HEMI
MPPGKAKVVMTLGRSITLSWTSPDDDGGCKIGNYIVEYYRIGWNMWLKAATCRQLTTTLGELIEGSEYKFRVKAENPYGVSDPSEESDVIFIPDPKRGLLEPPEHKYRTLDGENIEKWLEENKYPTDIDSNLIGEELYNTRRNKKYQNKVPVSSKENEEKSPLVKIVSKGLNKPMYKSIHSEDSMSPTVTPEPEIPVVPKRKIKAQKGSDFYEEEISNERKKSKGKLEQNVNKVYEWDKQIPRDEENILHGSSEMMLVLLPNSRATTEERDSRKNEFLTNLYDNDSIAPPMSLSAPELGYGEPIEFTLTRSAISSSELLHERMMSRFYQDISEEDNIRALKRRPSFERKRPSFERRLSFKEKDPFVNSKVKSLEEIRELSKAQLEGIQSSGNNTNDQYTTNDFDKSYKRHVTASTSIFKNDTNNDPDYSKRGYFLPQSSEEDVEYENESVDEEELEEEELSEEEMLDEEEESEDEYENNEYNVMTASEEDVRRSEYFQEETYHPRSMVPTGSSLKEDLIEKTLQKQKVAEVIDDITTDPEVKNLKKPYSRAGNETKRQNFINQFVGDENINMNIEKDQFIDKNRVTTNFDLLCDNKQPVNTTPMLSAPLKPILKVRDYFQEPLSETKLKNKHEAPLADVEAELNIISKATMDESIKVRTNVSNSKVRLRKKTVRIEEPEGKVLSDDFVENEIGISAAEVARNRRRRSGSLGEETDSQRIVINHYSDLVAEYGKTKSSPKYLDYEELRAAAQKLEMEISNDKTNKFETTKQHITLKENKILTINKNIDGKVQSNNISHEFQAETPNDENKEKQLVVPRQHTIAERKMHRFFDFVLDLVLFLVACWLCVFKDERLAIPLILLLIYRQTFEAIKKKLPSKWVRK